MKNDPPPPGEVSRIPLDSSACSLEEKLKNPTKHNPTENFSLFFFLGGDFLRYSVGEGACKIYFLHPSSCQCFVNLLPFSIFYRVRTKLQVALANPTLT